MLLLPVWIGVMLFKGVLYEARIYGELCPYAAVACVLLMEQYVNREAVPGPARSMSSKEKA